MIPFHRLFQNTFSSFDIGKDTAFISRLDSEWVDACMIIKRSWIYGVFVGFSLLPIALLFAINIALILYAYPTSVVFLTVAALLALDFCYLAFEHVRYFLHFRRVYGAVSAIVRPHVIRYESEEGNQIFARIFDHVVLSIVFLFLLMVFTIAAQVITVEFATTQSVIVTVVNAVVFFMQMGLMWGFVKKLIHLEMDFTVVVPGKIWFFNQTGLLSDSKVIDADKVKSVTGKVGSFLGSFLSYGYLSVLTEGDELGVIDLNYIGDPDETARRIDIMLTNDDQKIREASLSFFQTVLAAVGLTAAQAEAPSGRSRVWGYLKNFEKEIQEDFTEGDATRQQEIREVYQKFMRA